MPATEQTWYDSKVMHVVFGVSALLMLGASIWMLADDHNREWKQYQRTTQVVSAAYTQYQIDEQRTADYLQREADLEAQLREAQARVPEKKVVDAFLVNLLYHQAIASGADLGAVEDEYANWWESEVKDAAAAAALLERLRQYGGDDLGIPAAYEQVIEAEEAGPAAVSAALRSGGNSLLRVMQRQIDRLRFEEESIAGKKKFRAADLAVEDSEFGIGVRDSASPEDLAARKAEFDSVRDEVEQLDLELQRLVAFRKSLETSYADVTAAERAAAKSLADHHASLELLHSVKVEEGPSAAKKFLQLPIIDAFGGPLKVNQIWLPELLQDFNFKGVARFDRCTTCHASIDKTRPGSAVAAAFPPQRMQVAALATPETPILGEDDKTVDLRATYGLAMAEEGLLVADAPTVAAVDPATPAAAAGLLAGDVIAEIEGRRVFDLASALEQLRQPAVWGEPIHLTIKRGLPHPFSSHPRLDLFLGSTSPHKIMEFGCTACHSGQGSSTSFQWASHTPNTPAQEENWRQEYGWFDNHHWIYPMMPERFNESSCLKCHHDVTELEPSEKFPEAPAPKVVQGRDEILNLGCFGCHEINGYSGPDQRIGPDLRLEPNYAAVAAQMSALGLLDDAEEKLADRVIESPEDAAARHRLLELLSEPLEDGSERELSSVGEDLKRGLGDVEAPGKLRKVGPSLRYVASKLDVAFLEDWISNPRNFRPDTKMPRFFGLHDHLDGESLAIAQRMEPVEIASITAYLLSKSQEFEFVSPEGGEPSAERGKLTFQNRCLACHQHADFPNAEATQGPDLSRIGGKLPGEQGFKWLYSWIRQPTSYHARTVMPQFPLAPTAGEDGVVVDPAADIAAFLQASNQGDWSPADAIAQDDPAFLAALDVLALEHLTGGGYSDRQANRYLAEGIPQAMAASIKGDEVELVGASAVEAKLNYVGRRTISKYGCYGCHDIPGFETSKPIGTALADWGKKDPARIAFEHITHYVDAKLASESGDGDVHEDAEHEGAHEPVDVQNLDPDVGYFVESLRSHQRIGFLWQKLREPRSYDYRKTENKTYNERLRMPLFNLSEDDVEAVMTFVLGLVADPPGEKYVYQPTPERAAEIAGRDVLAKYNCKGCHTLGLEQWDVDFEPTMLDPPPPADDYAFLAPDFTAAERTESAKLTRGGLAAAHLVGRQIVDDQGRPEILSDDYEPLTEEDVASGEFNPNWRFTLWEPTLIAGEAYRAGDPAPLIPFDAVTRRTPEWGGDLARWIYPDVLARERTFNPSASKDEAWAWLPPPLVNEGRKVRPEWLHNFLLEPFAIRPSVVLRMPKFNMSSEEATQLVEYFAAVDSVHDAYDFSERRTDEYLEEMNAEHPGRFGDALNIVANNNYCVKCHIVGDYSAVGQPTSFGTDKAAAPDLSKVYGRLRPDFMQRWIANPKLILPYTGMPVNIPHNMPVAASLYDGDSEQQLAALVDLLANFDKYARGQTNVSTVVEELNPPAAAAADQAANP